MRHWIGTALGIATLGMAVAALAAGMAGETDEMVGAERCGQCHPAAFEAWSRSAHARADKALDAAQARDPRCTQCHGSSLAAKRGVQCESCHGPGQHYAFSYVMKDHELSRIVGLVDPDAETCERCHTASAPSIQPFDYDRLWSTIAHGQNPPPAAAEKGH